MAVVGYCNLSDGSTTSTEDCASSGTNFSGEVAACTNNKQEGLSPVSLPTLAPGLGCWQLWARGRDLRQLLGGHSVDMAALPPQARSYLCHSGYLLKALDSKLDRPLHGIGYSGSAVVLIEDFLSPDEVKHLTDLAMQHVKQDGDDPTHRVAYLVGAQYGNHAVSSRPELDVRLPEDTTLNAVEERIGAFLRIPASWEEKPVQMSMSVGRPEILGVENTMQTVHHDKNSGLTRRATAILYLNEPAEGGETIFPALPSLALGAQPAPRSHMQQEFATAFGDLVRKELGSLKSEKPWPSLALSEVSVEYAKVERLCAELLNSTIAAEVPPSVAIKPAPGRAVFFWSETAKRGEALLDVLHAGCPVKRGAKLAMQKFKHFANDHPKCQDSRWCRIGYARALEYSQTGRAAST